MDPKMKSRFLSLYQMVLADGIIDAAEIETLHRIGRESYGILPDQISEVIRDADFSISLPTKLEESVTLLYQLAEIAWADGNIDNSEIELLKRHVVDMGFEAGNSDEIAKFILEQVKNGKSLGEVLNMINQ